MDRILIPVPPDTKPRLNDLSLTPNDDTMRVSEICVDSIKEYFGGVMSSSDIVIGTDGAKNDVLLFIPLSILRQHHEDKIARFLAELKKRLDQAGLKVTEELVLDKSRYIYVDFSSRLLRICPKSRVNPNTPQIHIYDEAVEESEYDEKANDDLVFHPGTNPENQSEISAMMGD